MTYLIRRRDLEFMLYEVLDIESVCESGRYADHSRDIFAQVMDTAERIAGDLFAPHAALADRNEPQFDAGRVRMIPQVKEALDAYVEAGLSGAAFDTELGGMQLPYAVTQAVASIFNSANAATAGYALLSGGAASLLCAHGSPGQIERYARPLIAGRFFGTMCLSETQAGSSLADIRTRAEPAGDGRYRLFGSKMWISGGEHDLAENIVHLVLARIPGAPAGVKGISLFVVPKFQVADDGTLGERNDVVLAGINHKMGARGTVNTVLNFGERDGALGEIVGAPGHGLTCMFHMMNEARISVGLGATAIAYSGYLHALDYARGRRQGRPLTNRDPTAPMIPIIEHADVKRMLMQQKAYAEGGLMLGLYCAKLVDMRHLAAGREGGQKEHRRLSLLLDLLTPVAKSWPSEFGTRANDQAIQVHGGYGYTREYAVERLYRDNRLNAIHEGTKGIHGLDLLGRKVGMAGGEAMDALGAQIAATITAARELSELEAWAEQLEQAWRLTVETTARMHLGARESRPEQLLANATLYLDAFGHVVVAWLWLLQATRAVTPDKDGAERHFYLGKRQACRYFHIYELPKIVATLGLLESLDDTCLAMPDKAF